MPLIKMSFCGQWSRPLPLSPPVWCPRDDACRLFHDFHFLGIFFVLYTFRVMYPAFSRSVTVCNVFSICWFHGCSVPYVKKAFQTGGQVDFYWYDGKWLLSAICTRYVFLFFFCKSLKRKQDYKGGCAFCLFSFLCNRRRFVEVTNSMTSVWF